MGRMTSAQAAKAFGARMPVLPSGKPKRHKYGAQRTEADGLWFDSKKEARRYTDLKFMERIGEIQSLQLQMKFPLSVAGVVIGRYVADFVYFQDGKRVVEDVKGMKTDMYRWKKKHMQAEYGITIREV